MSHKLVAALVLLVAVALVSGCAQQITRTADPTEGDFYTEEEYESLTTDQREAYCVGLLAAYDEGQDCVDTAKAGLARESEAIGDLEDVLADLTPQLMSLRGEVEGLLGQIAYFEGLPRMYMVEKGDFLYKIAGMEEVYADPLKWKRIYRANKSAIDGFSDPNLIYPDWELTIPRDWPHSYTVKEGESLWMIANRWEIYADGRLWTQIFGANGDVLSDPDMVRPGQTLTIPR